MLRMMIRCMSLRRMSGRIMYVDFSFSMYKGSRYAL